MTIHEAVQLAWQHQRSGNLAQVEQIARQILAVSPQESDAWQLLGVVAYQVGRHDAALECLMKALAIRPDSASYLSNLGLVYHALGRSDEAVATYRRALEIAPQLAEAHNNLANVFKESGRLDEAVGHYRRALEIKPNYADALQNLAGALKDQGRLEPAVQYYRQALSLQPRHAEAHRNLGNALIEQGRYDEALASYNAALEIAPTAGLFIRSALALPVIPDSLAAIDACRRRLSDEVDRLLGEKLSVADPTKEIGLTPFHLAYHGSDDRELLARIAKLCLQASPALSYVAPHCAAPVAGPVPSRSLRVGFVSKFFREHSIGRHYAGLFAEFARPEFHVTAFRFPGPDDEVAQAIGRGADAFVTLSPQLAVAQQQIARHELDALVYTDIGMDPWTYFLAFARLARVQCVLPGHPMTTGIPNVDYFLSSDDLEPPDGQEHYTENLVRFRSLPTAMAAPEPPTPSRSRADFGLPDDAHLYVCAQTLFKLHPDFDAVLASILRADPRGRVVLFAAKEPHWTERIEKRLRESLSDVADRLQFVPRQDIGDFRLILALADVVLDTIYFGGGTTTLEALAAGTPIVTLPGPLMRSRQTLACYRKLGLTDCVARDTDDYVRLVVQLGSDPARREQLRAELLAKKEMLFDSHNFVRELEQFFREALK